MATLSEMLDDKKKYADDQKITLADGVETTFGELRGGFMKEKDYRQKTQTLSDERRELQRKQSEFESGKAEAEMQLRELASELVRQQSSQPGNRTKDPEQELLENDPVGKALVAKLSAYDEKINKLDSLLSKADERIKNQEKAWYTAQHQMVLGEIRKFDPDVDQEKLVKFCQDNGINRLDYGYRLMTEQDRFKKSIDDAVDKAKKEGIEEGKKAQQQVVIHPRRTPDYIPDGEKQFTSFDEAQEAALNDPEIITLLEGPQAF